MAEDPIRSILKFGHDVTLMPPMVIPKEIQKGCLFIVNTNASYRTSLGIDPISNAADFAKLLKYYDYQNFILCTPHVFNVLERIEHFCKITNKSLIIYYCGQDFTLDGHKEVFVFDDGKITFEDFSRTLCKSKNPTSKLTLINDYGASKIIFDAKHSEYNLPPNVVTIMSKPKCRESKNYVRMFAYYLTKELTEHPSISPKNLKKNIKRPMKKFGYKVKIWSTDDKLLDTSLL